MGEDSEALHPLMTKKLRMIVAALLGFGCVPPFLASSCGCWIVMNLAEYLVRTGQSTLQGGGHDQAGV